MNQQGLINQLRDELAAIVTQTDGNTAMGLTDHNKIAENLICGLMREILGLRNLTNVNAAFRENYPAIDLADFDARVAVQVTATPTLSKVTKTIEKFLEYDLDQSFDRLIVYNLARKQASYSQSAIDKEAGSRLPFNGKSDILDFTDLLEHAVHLNPARLSAALRVIQSYNRGVPVGLAEDDFDPPTDGTETIHLNLVQFFFPSILYVADILPDFLVKPKGARYKSDRAILRTHGHEMSRTIPSDFYIHGDQLLTFRNLYAEDNPFAWAVDSGTVVELSPDEFYGIDGAQERVFKALLRFMLQEKLYRERVLWIHSEKLFAFLPLNEQDQHREIAWQGIKRSERHVYEQKMNKKNAEVVFTQKHFAFAIDFHHLQSQWYVSLTPNWYFSHGADFRPSRYAGDNISWLKTQGEQCGGREAFSFPCSLVEGA